jgi:hypothetical protein
MAELFKVRKSSGMNLYQRMNVCARVLSPIKFLLIDMKFSSKFKG